MTRRDSEPHEIVEPVCPRCVRHQGDLDPEMIQPLPYGARAPLARDGSGKCCHDCASADALMAITSGKGAQPLSFVMARIAIGTDRQRSLRLPNAPIGLIVSGLMRASKPGDLERHHKWLSRHNLL